MYKIAIVDDERDILEVLEEALSRKFQVTTFLNPLDALSEIKSGKFDLVLSDIMMPQIDGLTLLKRVRESNKSVAFIMMTAFDSMDKALEAHTYGASNYIKKPFKSLRDIEEKITKALQ